MAMAMNAGGKSALFRARRPAPFYALRRNPVLPPPVCFSRKPLPKLYAHHQSNPALPCGFCPPKPKPLAKACNVVKAKSDFADDDSDDNEHEMQHVLWVLNSAYLLGLGQMNCGQLIQYVHLMESMQCCKCVYMKQCMHMEDCMKLGECILLKELKLELKVKEKKVLVCLNPSKCVKMKECFRKMDCLEQEMAEEENLSLSRVIKGGLISLFTTLEPVTLVVIFVISLGLSLPNSRIFQLASKVVYNFLRFWYYPLKFSGDWFGRKFVEYRSYLFRLGDKYGRYLPRSLVAVMYFFGFDGAFPIVVLGWFLTIGSSLTVSVLVFRFNSNLARSLFIWLINHVIQLYCSIVIRLYALLRWLL